MNHACKHDFLDLHNLSRNHDHILIVMIFRYFSFEVCFVTIIKSDVMMMKYVIRVKPFGCADSKWNGEHDVSSLCHPIG